MCHAKTCHELHGSTFVVHTNNVDTCFTIITVPVMVDPEKDSYFAGEIRPQFQ